jgi:hypothetical protein
MLSFRNALALGVALLALAAPAPAAAPEKLLPGDSEIVAALNIRQMMDSALFKKYGLEPFKDLLKRDEAAKAIEATGLDPLKDVSSLWVSSRAEITTTPKLVFALHGKFDRDKIEKAVKGLPGLTSTKDKDSGLTIYETPAAAPGQPNLFSAFAGPDAILMATSRDLLGKAAKGEKLNADMAKAMDAYTGKESIYVAGLITKEIKEQLAKQAAFKEIAPKLESVVGVVTVGDGVDLKLTVNCTDADTANALKALVDLIALPLLKNAAEKQAAVPDYAKDLLKQIKTTTARSSVSVSMNISADTIDKAMKPK